MKKNIEALTEIKPLDIVIEAMKTELENEKNGFAYWKQNFRIEVNMYKKAKNKAVSSGFDFSDYEKEFLELTRKYSEITGEKDIAELTEKEIVIRNKRDYKTRIKCEQF